MEEDAAPGAGGKDASGSVQKSVQGPEDVNVRAGEGEPIQSP